MSYLTADEVQAVQHLPRDTPYLIAGVSSTQFSLACRAGGMKLDGHRYVYLQSTDECIRADVLRFVDGRRRAQAREAKREAQAAQGTLL